MFSDYNFFYSVHDEIGQFQKGLNMVRWVFDTILVAPQASKPVCVREQEADISSLARIVQSDP